MTTIMGEDVKDIPRELFYRSYTGNCFNIRDDLYPYLIEGSTTDPYQGTVPLWRNAEELNEIINHPGLTPEEQQNLKAKFHNVNPIKNEIIELMIRNVDLFELIGATGLILYGDYGDDFADSLEALTRLRIQIDESPDKDMFLELKALTKGRNSTIAEIISRQSTACIHGIGIELLTVFLTYYKTFDYMLPTNPFTLPQGFHQLDNQNIILFNVYSFIDICVYVGIYIHDEDTYGRDSRLGHLARVYMQSKSIALELFTTVANSTNLSGSMIAYPNDRQITMFDVAATWLTDEVNDGILYLPQTNFNLNYTDMAYIALRKGIRIPLQPFSYFVYSG
jgi:hypothetical protein